MLKNYLRDHWATALLGLLLTLIITAPVLAFPFFSQNYQGINITHFGGDGHFYFSRAKEALEGHSLGNVFFREGKENQDPFFMYNEQLLFVPLRYLGLAGANAVNIYLVYNFTGIFAIILLINFVCLPFGKETLIKITLILPYLHNIIDHRVCLWQFYSFYAIIS